MDNVEGIFVELAEVVEERLSNSFLPAAFLLQMSSTPSLTGKRESKNWKPLSVSTLVGTPELDDMQCLLNEDSPRSMRSCHANNL